MNCSTLVSDVTSSSEENISSPESIIMVVLFLEQKTAKRKERRADRHSIYVAMQTVSDGAY
jgi:hypothetical protein